uniref:Late embryogenesis abundant protein LEA-2 subgroup domain-containing protein n=1 Tax=Kalanchoe fedtschenkoi TaxID=63787 RepID=A0A7N0ZRR8_KALFE
MTTESGSHRRGGGPSNYHHYRPRSSSSASFKGCCCCLFLLLSFLLLLALAIFLILFLAVKPKKPQFDLQQVAVQYLGITGTTTSNIPSPAAATASVSLNFKMWFTAVNPNKVGIKYGESRFTVIYRGIPLGRAVVPGFYQPAHSERELQTTVVVDRVSLAQADAANLLKDATDNDRVELRILGEVPAKIRIMDFTSPGIQVSVDCAIAISPTKKALTYKQCGFDGLSV